MLRTVRFLALLLVLLLGGAWVFAWVTRAPGESLADAFAARLGLLFGGQMPVPAAGGVQLPQGMSLGGAFTLVDQAGRTVTERDYAGRWALVYFGYSFCPDVCPTELGTMAAALDAMGPAGERVVPIFITVDPERDTPAHLADYVSRFHPRMQGLTGSPEQVAEAARRYRVYFARARSANNTDYLMDHSSFIYLVGPDARVRALFRPEAKPEDIAAAVTAQLGGTRSGG
ncbi:SCO family protein [Paracraurococcus ruber]|uniref:SCO family protein n=1 Tax=Paracraurococcus ruber TaxID=77675 RepID=A0ABS1CUL7_9PROT|nr:SCO family protein [Paracraurococcus ruber]MBK1658200.1 SCO family protein [Paracraurococcus ruber]TDG27057.1 SCO family protein [Paracraurococcus ruber]